MKKTLIFLIILIPIIVFSQSKKRGEIGIFGGGNYYIGELNKTPFSGTQLAGGVLYRHTFDTRFAAKGQFNVGKIAQEGSAIDDSPQTFNHIFYDLSVMGEFNFFPYLSGSKNYAFTPYVQAGLGFLFYNGYQAPSGRNIPFLNLPFGFGGKFNINDSWSWGIEYTLKKTFNDYLDYEYQIPDETTAFKQVGYQGDKDWLHVFGVYVTHKIKYRVKCPAFD